MEFTFRIGQFLRASGALLLLWGIAAWVLPFSEGDLFYTDLAYAVFYLAIGLLFLWAGITWSPEIRHLWTGLFGAFFVALSIVGWAISGQEAPNLGITNFESIDNVVHLLLGLLFLLVAFQSRSDQVYLEPAGTAINVK